MKKLIALLLVFSMMLSVLAGCGKSAADTPETELPENEQPEIAEPTEGKQKEPLDATVIAQLARAATVTVHADNSSGTGFFIDDKGTLITCYHVIDGTTELLVETSEGAYYAVVNIVDFNEQYDIAVLTAKVTGNSYLEISMEPVVQGQTVYANGSSLGLDGTFSNGIISAESRKIGIIDCVQTTAATSSGNSGGPLLNAYGQVVGINAYGYNGQNLNLAIDVAVLNNLSMDKYWDMSNYREWYDKEISRSYRLYDKDQVSFFAPKVHTYQNITGRKCSNSGQDWKYITDGKGSRQSGYKADAGVYYYEYEEVEYDQYTVYLKSIGFVYQSKKEYDDHDIPGTAVVYYNAYTGVAVMLYVYDNESTVVIQAYYP